MKPRITDEKLAVARARMSYGIPGELTDGRTTGRRLKAAGAARPVLLPNWLAALEDPETGDRVIRYAVAAMNAADISRVIAEPQRSELAAIIPDAARRFALGHRGFALSRPPVEGAALAERMSADRKACQKMLVHPASAAPGLRQALEAAIDAVAEDHG